MAHRRDCRTQATACQTTGDLLLRLQPSTIKRLNRPKSRPVYEKRDRGKHFLNSGLRVARVPPPHTAASSTWGHAPATAWPAVCLTFSGLCWTPRERQVEFP